MTGLAHGLRRRSSSPFSCRRRPDCQSSATADVAGSVANAPNVNDPTAEFELGDVLWSAVATFTSTVKVCDATRRCIWIADYRSRQALKATALL